jgi:hypothetical protein
VKSISDESVVAGLIERLQRLTPASPRRWGTMSAAEMLCHLGDANESVLGIRVPPGPPASGRPRPILKWFMLYAPMPWPRGVRTRPGVNPKQDGTRPGDFEQDRARAEQSLRQLARAPAEQLSPHHFMAGPMSRNDWHRWAYKHFDHHLRQFGL